MTLTRMIFGYFLAVSATAADAQADAILADLLFREGRELMTSGKIAEACAAFERSQGLDPAITTLINLAACRETQGQIATAWRLFLDAERQTRSANDDVTAQLHKIALDHAARLKARVSKLRIRVPDQNRLARLQILRDREPIPAEMWNRALPIDGGTYTIIARAPGAYEWSVRITLVSEADVKTVDIPNLRDFDEPDFITSRRSSSSASQLRAGFLARHRWSIGLGIGAFVTSGAGLVMGGLTWRDYRHLGQSCVHTIAGCRDSDVRAVERKELVVNILFGTAAASAIAATVGYFVGDGRRSTSASAPLIVAPSRYGITLNVRF